MLLPDNPRQELSQLEEEAVEEEAEVAEVAEVEVEVEVAEEVVAKAGEPVGEVEAK